MDISNPPVNLSPEDLAQVFPGLDNSMSKARKRAVLIAYVMLGGLYRACAAAKVNPGLHYVWMRNDPAYAEAYKEAQAMSADMLEQAAYNRAVGGVDRPVYYQGEVVGSTKEYSDGLLKFLLKGNRPAKYMERADITSGGASLRIVIDGSDKADDYKEPEATE